MDDLTLQEQSLQEQIEWRRKIRNIDASLHRVLRDAAAQEEAHKPLLSRMLGAAKTKPETVKHARGFRLGFHAGT